MKTKEANLIAVFSLGLMLIIWLIEFKGILNFSVGPPREATGRITSCEGAGKDSGWLKWKRKQLVLHLDSLPSLGIQFVRPASVRDQIVSLCERRAHVRIVYQVGKPPLSRSEKYWLRGITDIKKNQVVFTHADHDAAKNSDRPWAYGLFIFAAFAFLYAAGIRTGIISGKGKWEFQHEQHHGYERGRFIIRSRQRRGEAFAYVVLYLGLSVMFGYYLMTGKWQSWWILLPVAVFLIAAYAYLVEIVNVSELTFDDNALVYRQAPLPWIVRRARIPVEHIAEVLAEETEEWSAHGKYYLSSVGLRLSGGETVTLFFTPTLTEAEAIAELINRHLAVHYPNRRR